MSQLGFHGETAGFPKRKPRFPMGKPLTLLFREKADLKTFTSLSNAYDDFFFFFSNNVVLCIIPARQVNSVSHVGTAVWGSTVYRNKDCFEVS